jgi:hypothetical protein
MGHGIIFHWADGKRIVSLTLDHSIFITGGIFLLYSVNGLGPLPELNSLAQQSEQEFDELLLKVGIELVQ